jgi:glyoxylase-like metal-dependent hydrolase (beta-lactamase superfamily II)
MKCVELAPGIFHLQSGSNVGLIIRDDQALLIDTGLDEDAGRRALRIAEGKGATLKAIFITHAHADHFGGAQFLQRRLNVPLYAPKLEAAMMENPIIEPLYLFGGAAPIAELRQKFTLGAPCEVTHPVEPGPLEIDPFQIHIVSLPGHALNQVGVAADDILFCADAVFPQQTIEKHKILFCVDLDDTLETLADLPNRPYGGFAPGHGPAYGEKESIETICNANRDRLEEVREGVYDALGQPLETSSLVQRMARRFQLKITTPTAYFLTRTTVLAALSSLEAAGQVAPRAEDNQLQWRRK